VVQIWPGLFTLVYTQIIPGHIWTTLYNRISRGTLWINIEKGLILRRFILRLFTFTSHVQSDRALPTCGASLSQLKRPFCTYCVSSSFPVCLCFFFFNFSAVLLRWVWVFHQRSPSKRQKRRKNQKSWCHILSWCLLNHCLVLLEQN